MRPPRPPKPLLRPCACPCRPLVLSPKHPAGPVVAPHPRSLPAQPSAPNQLVLAGPRVKLVSLPGRALVGRTGRSRLLLGTILLPGRLEASLAGKPLGHGEPLRVAVDCSLADESCVGTLEGGGVPVGGRDCRRSPPSSLGLRLLIGNREETRLHHERQWRRVNTHITSGSLDPP